MTGAFSKTFLLTTQALRPQVPYGQHGHTFNKKVADLLTVLINGASKGIGTYFENVGSAKLEAVWSPTSMTMGQHQT
jgi:hypothetical protein